MLHSAPMELDRISAQDFRNHLGSALTVTAPSGESCELKIFAVRDLEKEPRPGTLRAAFAVEFAGPAGLTMPQQIYSVRHADLGDAEIFIVPLAPDVYGSKFEALFN